MENDKECVCAKTQQCLYYTQKFIMRKEGNISYI